jgi:hypothetical protein
MEQNTTNTHFNSSLLDIRRAQLHRQNMTSRIAETIRTLDQKKFVSLHGCGPGDEDAAAFADALKVNTSVTIISLIYN